MVADSGGGSPRLLAADSVVTTGPLGGPTTSLTVHNNQPDFSPNGRQILFTRSVVRANGNGTTITQSQLEIVGVDGTGARALTKPTVLDSRGSWSPSGREIAYQEASHGGTVWVMNANGTGRREVAHGHYPFFSSIQGPIPARPRISVHVLKLNPGRACFSHDDGWGALVTTTATKQTLYTVSMYLDGRLGFQTEDALRRFGGGLPATRSSPGEDRGERCGAPRRRHADDQLPVLLTRLRPDALRRAAVR